MKNSFFVLTLFLCSSIFAQSYKFSISGKINSTKDKTAIEAATIHLEKAKDSSIVSYTISDSKGEFSLEGKSYNKNVKLFISFIGMDNYSKIISLEKTPNLNLGTISLKEESNLLNEVVIKSRAPITIKKDTLEFNVKSFKTKKNANVEDLLKKLPGVEVDEQGKITVNGKPVNKILVNGKPFFGNDPTITTKNLSKEIIEKIQVTDTKSKSEAFSGEEGDANNKTINLTIKKENNKGWFGRVSGGIGSDKRYEAATMINRFNNNTRVSVLASANNINSPGFSFGEIQKMYGGGSWLGSDGSFSIRGRRFGGGQGIVKSKIAGITYADTYGKGVDINTNYITSISNSDNLSKNNRTYTVTVKDPNSPTDNIERTFFTNAISSSFSKNENHNIDTELDIEIDSTFLINIKPRFILNKAEQQYTTNTENLDENTDLTNRFQSSVSSSSESKSFENQISITKKIGKKGSFIKTVISNKIDQSDDESFNNSSIEFFSSDPRTEINNQKSIVDNNLNGIQSRFAYRLPVISKKLFLDTKYNYQRNERENIQSTFDFNNTSNNYTDFNTNLSSNFIYNDITKRPSLKLQYDAKKLNFNLEIGKVFRTLKNTDALRPNLSLNRNFNNLTLNTSIRYRLKSKASIYFNYSVNNDAPSINQIQPFTNITNPSNKITGNPNLKPSKNHQFYLNFNKYNWQKRTGFFAYAGGNLTNDQIITKSDIDEQLVRTTTYTNEDGAYNFWAGINYNKKVKLDSISSINLKIGGRFNTFKNITILNDFKNITINSTYTPSIGVTYNWNKIISIEPRYNINISNITTNTNTASINQQFTNHSLSIRTKTNVPKKLEWRNNIRYTFNPNVVGFNQSSWFWNSTLSYSIFKERATILLKAYDLLNQNTNALRRSGNNFIEDTESTVLQQYFMLGFSWKFNSLGKKGKVKEYNFHF